MIRHRINVSRQQCRTSHHWPSALLITHLPNKSSHYCCPAALSTPPTDVMIFLWTFIWDFVDDLWPPDWPHTWETPSWLWLQIDHLISVWFSSINEQNSIVNLFQFPLIVNNGWKVLSQVEWLPENALRIIKSSEKGKRFFLTLLLWVMINPKLRLTKLCFLPAAPSLKTFSGTILINILCSF